MNYGLLVFWVRRSSLGAWELFEGSIQFRSLFLSLAKYPPLGGSKQNSTVTGWERGRGFGHRAAPGRFVPGHMSRIYFCSRISRAGAVAAASFLCVSCQKSKITVERSTSHAPPCVHIACLVDGPARSTSQGASHPTLADLSSPPKSLAVLPSSVEFTPNAGGLTLPFRTTKRTTDTGLGLWRRAWPFSLPRSWGAGRA